MSQVLANSAPRVSSSMAGSWQFAQNGIGMANDLYPDETVSGPDAAVCGGYDVLMVYATFPFTVPDPSSGQPDTCKHV